MATLVDKSYWKDHWENAEFPTENFQHPVKNWLKENVPETEKRECIELGCYPGKFLAVFGEKGYKLHRVDIEGNLKNMKSWLEGKGHKTGHFKKKDFFHVKD